MAVKSTDLVQARLSDREGDTEDRILEREALYHYQTWKKQGHTAKQIVIAGIHALVEKMGEDSITELDKIRHMVEEIHEVVVNQKPVSKSPRGFEVSFSPDDTDDVDSY